MQPYIYYKLMSSDLLIHCVSKGAESTTEQSAFKFIIQTINNHQERFGTAHLCLLHFCCTIVQAFWLALFLFCNLMIGYFVVCWLMTSPKDAQNIKKSQLLHYMYRHVECNNIDHNQERTEGDKLASSPLSQWISYSFLSGGFRKITK